MLFKDTNLRKIPLPEKATYLYDSAYTGKGSFCLRLPKKSKSKKQQALTFVFKYKLKIDGQYKIHLIKIGQFPAFKADEARAIARKYSDMLKQGLNPKEVIEAEADAKQKELEQKQIEEAQGTLEQLVNAYLANLEKQGKRTGARILKTIEADVYPVIGKEVKACTITPQHIKKILATMIQRDAAVGSNRVRSNLSAIFNFGLKFDNDPANFGHETIFHLQGNPVTPVPKQKVEQPENNFLNIDEVYRLFSLETAQHFTEDTFLLIQLCFHLGGQRPYELVASKWSEVDFKGKTFEIAEHISKTKKPHLLPLTDSALQILKRLHALSGSEAYIFPRPTKSGHLETDYFGHCLRKFCSRTGFKKFIPRDIRRTCKTLMGEIGLSKDIRDRLQNHALHDVSSRHYDRYSYIKEKKQALEAWEARLNASQATSNVIAIGI
tara:strand:- start:4731 stop:6041 length:1311 start_codon:yes stop_codon:yes gene_type:complete